MKRVRIEAVEWSERRVKMRLPFQFGSTTMRQTGEAHCKLHVVIDGRIVEGRSAQLMVPRWFDKRIALSTEETVQELRESVTKACLAAPGMHDPVAPLVQDLRAEVEARMAPSTPRLAAGFGPALLEMALVDAICRAAGLPFWRAAREDLFELSAHLPADVTREAFAGALERIGPPVSIRLRHTVGYDAPLTADEIGVGAPQDGLPVALEEAIAVHGITAFKIKLKGDPASDLARLGAIAPIVTPCAGLVVTLDANEQYDAGRFLAFLAEFRRDEALAPVRRALRFVEQPFDRETALSTRLPRDINLPLVIDESDDHDGAFATALGLGWAGTSIKSCKGVLRALLNRARAEAAGAILSGEDLTCQPGLAWQQDTAMAAACGVRDIERNGHHFAGGMQGAPEAEVARRMAEHGDIYHRIKGRPALKIEHGTVSIGSLDRVGFGGV